jgi:hypothetical protein
MTAELSKMQSETGTRVWGRERVERLDVGDPYLRGFDAGFCDESAVRHGLAPSRPRDQGPTR